MSTYKRRRPSTFAVSLGAARPFTAPPQRKRARKVPIVPGRTRVGGYYGRYSGPVGRGGELKFHDVALADAVVATGGNMTATVNIIPQGVTEIQRIGRKCTIKSINWRYQISLPEQDAITTPGGGDTVRVIMYLDKQCNGATAANTDILESNDWQSFRNLANTGRFVILLDKLHTLNYGTLASDGAGVVSSADVLREATFFKKCDIPIEFNSTTGAIGEIRSNNIGVMLMGHTGIAGFTSRIRLRFSDR